MFTAWEIAVVLNARSNASRVFAQTAGGANRATTAVNAHAAAMTRLASAARVANVAMTSVGIVLGAAMIKGIQGAADLETAMVSVRNATGATTAQMERLRAKAFEVSAATAQSVVDSAHIMAVMATSGINDPNKLYNIARPAAIFADVQFLKSQGRVSFEDAARQAIQVAHLYQAYDPKQVEPIFDQLTKLSFMMPDNLNRYLTQASYYMPLFRRMHVDPKESLVLGAWMDRMGLGRGKGGTGLQQFLLQQMQPLQMTGHMQTGRRDALRALGLMNPDGSSAFLSGGQFHVIDALRQINAVVNRRTSGLTGHARDVAIQSSIVDIQKALGVQGGRIGFLGTPEAVAQLDQMLKQLAKMPGMYEMQRRSMDTLNGQVQLFKTNVSSMLTDAMWGSLPWLKGEFHSLAEAAHNAQVWIHAHRDETNQWVKVALIPIGWAITSLGLASWRAIAALAGLPASLDRMSGAVSRLGVSSAAAGGEIGAAGTAAGGAIGALSKLNLVLLSIAGLAFLYEGTLAVLKNRIAADKLHKQHIRVGDTPHGHLQGEPNRVVAPLRPGVPGITAPLWGGGGTSVHVDHVTVMLPKGSSRDQAIAFVDAVKNLRTAGRSSGDRSPGIPRFSPLELVSG